MNQELAKTLTTALVQFIDRERPEGTMCCSNTECIALEQSFKLDNFDNIEAFIQKKLSRLTEFEEELVNFYNKRSILPSDKDGVYNRHDCEELLHESAKALLAIAKKELCKECDANIKGYIKGQEDAEKRYNESVEYHFTPITVRPLCWEPGGTCTNPHMDCVNCPRKTTVGFNMQSGTSTAKMEG